MFLAYVRGQYTYVRTLIRQRYYLFIIAKQKDLPQVLDRMEESYKTQAPKNEKKHTVFGLVLLTTICSAKYVRSQLQHQTEEG